MSAPTNVDRATWANEALQAFAACTRCDAEDCLADLLADLMRWADRAGYSFDRELGRARFNYVAEVDEAAEEAI